MSATGDEMGVSLLFEDAQLDVGRQLSQVRNFAASGLDGVIIAPVDGGSTVAMTQAAEQAGIRRLHHIPYELVTPENLESFMSN